MGYFKQNLFSAQKSSVQATGLLNILLDYKERRNIQIILNKIEITSFMAHI